jgi:hypothetical protein
LARGRAVGGEEIDDPSLDDDIIAVDDEVIDYSRRLRDATNFHYAA